MLYDENGNEKEDLYNSRSEIFLGQIDRVIAKALKAKILLYRASPFFNGNSEFYSNFKNAAGEHTSRRPTTRRSGREALDAVEIAIKAAEEQGKSLYEFKGQVKFWDQDDWNKSEIMKYLPQQALCDQRPVEQRACGDTLNIYYTSSSSIAAASNLRGDGQSQQRLILVPVAGSIVPCASEMFDTRNGVPVDEDKTLRLRPSSRHHSPFPDDTLPPGLHAAGREDRQTLPGTRAAIRCMDGSRPLHLA